MGGESGNSPLVPPHLKWGGDKKNGGGHLFFMSPPIIFYIMGGGNTDIPPPFEKLWGGNNSIHPISERMGGDSKKKSLPFNGGGKTSMPTLELAKLKFLLSSGQYFRR